MTSSDIADGKAKPPWMVRAYDASRALFERSIMAARALFVGTWLGMLDREALHATDELYYRRALKYYDAQYNRSGLFPWETAAIERHFQGCRSVLVTAAGGGREVVALERRGLDVVAFECNPELVQSANELLSREGLRSRVALAPRDECPDEIPMCDGIIIGWTSYTLIQHRSSRVRFLRQLRTHVPHDAPVLLSFFAQRKRARYLRIVAATANVFRLIRGRQRAEVGDDLVPNFAHHFLESELAAELEAGGFRLVEFSQSGETHAVARAAQSASQTVPTSARSDPAPPAPPAHHAASSRPAAPGSPPRAAGR